MRSESGDRSVADQISGPAVPPLTDPGSLADHFYLRAYDEYEGLYPAGSAVRQSAFGSLAAPLKSPGLRALAGALALGVGLGVGLAYLMGPGRSAKLLGVVRTSPVSFAAQPLSRTVHPSPTQTAIDSSAPVRVPPAPTYVRQEPANSVSPFPAKAEPARLAPQGMRVNRPALATDSSPVMPTQTNAAKLDNKPLRESSGPPVPLPLLIADTHRELPMPVLQSASVTPAAKSETISQSAPAVFAKPAPVPAPPPAVSSPVLAGAQPLRRVVPDVLAPSIMLYKDLTVQVQVSLDAAGTVTAARLLPPPEKVNESLIGAALTAARQWRFHPATSSGNPVPSQYLITFRFHAHS